MAQVVQHRRVSPAAGPQKQGNMSLQIWWHLPILLLFSQNIPLIKLQSSSTGLLGTNSSLSWHSQPCTSTTEPGRPFHDSTDKATQQWWVRIIFLRLSHNHSQDDYYDSYVPKISHYASVTTGYSASCCTMFQSTLYLPIPEKVFTTWKSLYMKDSSFRCSNINRGR